MSSGDNDPNAWLGLLKWSLAHQDGTEPSDTRSMSDEDRAWLERVVHEGIRDDMKIMTQIYGRLCSYLDDLASLSTTASLSTSAAADGENTPTPLIGAADHDHQPPAVPPTPPAESRLEIQSESGSGTLSTYVAPPAAVTESVGATDGAGGGDGGMDAASGEDRLEGVMNDLEELQDIVEQIDMAETFAKIGGFGRLIALATPCYRPDKLRRRAASVIATLTKNNPPAQAAFSSSGGQRAILQALATVRSSSNNANEPVPAVRLSLLHALSCSVMGDSTAETSLCSEATFQQVLVAAIAQAVDQDGRDAGDGDGDTAARLRSKAAFVFKALVGAPGALASRVEVLWPAMLAIVEALEVLSHSGTGGDLGHDPAAARETCIEALLAAARSAGGERVVDELGPRVSVVMATRRQILVEGPSDGVSIVSVSQEDQESAAVELELWMEWEQLCGPAQ